MFVTGVVLQPIHVMHHSKSCAKFVGLVSFFGLKAHVTAIFVIAFISGNVAVALGICFFYRYDQLRRINVHTVDNGYCRLSTCVAMHILGAPAFGLCTYFLVSYAELTPDGEGGVYVMCYDESSYFMVARLSVLLCVATLGFVTPNRNAILEIIGRKKVVTPTVSLVSTNT
uniref:G protein-coupled receptor n=1 Tax=Steinernema glaseri TaxID=37863 RepID=A0A1I7ZA95_9BILA